jgi:hypothetical protein
MDATAPNSFGTSRRIWFWLAAAFVLLGLLWLVKALGPYAEYGSPWLTDDRLQSAASFAASMWMWRVGRRLSPSRPESPPTSSG